jgi:hypothetical protein
MSRIKLYPIDQNVKGGDKWIGTDSSNGQTKNFSVNEVVKYINESSAVDIQTLRYKFQVLEPGDTLELGSLSFDPPQGNEVLFTDVTKFILSDKSLKYVSQGTPVDISDFYTAIVGSQVFISDTVDISQFGVYDWDSAVASANPNFWDIGLTLVAGQGSLKKNQEYFISLLQWNPSANDGDKTFVFTQGTPIYQWDITHNLNKFPSVTAVNSFNEEVFGKVDYINKNRVTITFASPFSGQAYCN